MNFQPAKGADKTVLSIYTDLDTLFDTRLSIAMELDFFGTGEYVQSGKYYKRTHDQIGLIPYDVLQMYYKERHKHQLLQAMPTYIHNLIIDNYVHCVEQIQALHLDHEMKIWLNIYPYKLDDDELDVMLTMFNNDQIPINVEFVSSSNKDLHPKWVQRNVGTMYKYDFIEWFELHTGLENMTPTTLITMDVYFPMLHSVEVEYTPDINKLLIESFSLVTQPYPLQSKMFSATIADREQEQTLKDLTVNPHELGDEEDIKPPKFGAYDPNRDYSKFDTKPEQEK